MSKKTILITGCSSGIGYDAAHALHARGWRVFATCRKPADCTRLEGEGLESFVLDYADEASITDAVAEALKRTGGTLDALFNNGAYALPAAVEDCPRAALREIFEVNFFGQFDLIRQLMPAFHAQGHCRVVNNSSVLGLVAMRMRGAYVATKFAMEGMTDTLRLEYHGRPFHFILISPGPVTSDIRRNARAPFEKWIDWEASALRKVYEKQLRPRLYAENPARDRFELPASAVTAKLIHALESRRPKPRYYVTTPTHVMGALKRILPTRAFDAVLRRG